MVGVELKNSKEMEVQSPQFLMSANTEQLKDHLETNGQEVDTFLKLLSDSLNLYEYTYIQYVLNVV